jgi:hypothetical protein
MKIESQAILQQLVLTAEHRQLLRNHQLWLTKRKMPFGEFRSLRRATRAHAALDGHRLAGGGNIGCSANTPINTNLEKEQILWKSAPFDVIFSFRVQGR